MRGGKFFRLTTDDNSKEECNRRGHTKHGFLPSLAALVALLLTVPSKASFISPRTVL